MEAIELYPYWRDNRALLAEVTGVLRDEDLDFRPGPALRSIGEVLRHVITAEERWWHGGLQGEPYNRWRPPDWDRFTEAEKHEYRRRRFPTATPLLEGLRTPHEPLEAFLRNLAAAHLCLKRRATRGEGKHRP